MVAREDRPGDQRLVAYVVASGQAELDVSGLREQLTSTLPDYMVPAVVLELPAFPLTPSGKLDRKALPAPDWSALSNRSFEPPTSDLELIIASVWSEALGVDQVGTRDNFFDLGGHSLLLTRVHRALVKELGRDFSMIDLFRYPTVESLARHLDDGRDKAESFKTLEERRERARRKRAGGRRRRGEDTRRRPD